MIRCVPTESDEVVKVAWPPLSVAVPIVRNPSTNVTVPVGAGAPCGAETVAVSVTAWPLVDGFGDDESRVDVGTRRTSWNVESRLCAYVPSPEYVAVTRWKPRVSDAVVRVATPPAIGAVPRQSACAGWRRTARGVPRWHVSSARQLTRLPPR